MQSPNYKTIVYLFIIAFVMTSSRIAGIGRAQTVPEAGPIAQLQERVAFLEQSLSYATANLVPPGTIVMWSGNLSDIPAGWVICDGDNGTPDLQDRFVMGVYNDETPGLAGGSSEHVHAVPAHKHVENIPPHEHKYYRAEASTEPAAGSGWKVDEDDCNHGSLLPGAPGHDYAFCGHQHDSTHQHLIVSYKQQTFGVAAYPESEVSYMTNPAGETTLIADHLPPYYRLAFIMKLSDSN